MKWLVSKTLSPDRNVELVTRCQADNLCSSGKLFIWPSISVLILVCTLYLEFSFFRIFLWYTDTYMQSVTIF